MKLGLLCDYELSSGPSFEALAGAPLECYQLVVGGVSLAGVGADIHHLLPHRLVHVRVANHRVAATQHGLQRSLLLLDIDIFFHGFMKLLVVQLSWYVQNNRKRSIKSEALW